MYLSGISFIGWLHTIACIAALFFGAWNIVAVKRTRLHKLRGTAYVASMVVAILLSLLIYRFDIPVVRNGKPGRGVFGVFHWLAVLTLFFTVVGYYASWRQKRAFWAYVHPISMTLSYYLLLGGLINELFARVKILRPFLVTFVHGKPVFGSPTLSHTQLALRLATALVVILFIAQVWRYRQRNAAARLAKVPATKLPRQ